MTSYDEMQRVLGETHEREEKPAAEPVVPIGRAGGRTRRGLGRRHRRRGTADARRRRSGPPTVLVADDDPQMRRLIKTMLEREGLVVLEANDGLDALDVIGQHHVDLILLDQDMPRLTGLGVLEELRAGLTTATIPIIMLTAHADTETEAFELGAQDYLTKPVQPRSLVARVKAVLRRSAMD